MTGGTAQGINPNLHQQIARAPTQKYTHILGSMDRQRLPSPLLRVAPPMLTHNIRNPAKLGAGGTRLFSHREVQMKPSILLRVASVLTLIFCGGHTYGALSASLRDPEQAAVFMAMQVFPFEIM